MTAIDDMNEAGKDAAPTQPDQQEDSNSNDILELIIHHHGQPLTLSFPPEATISDLSSTVAESFSIPPSNQKFMITPKTGLLRPPFKEASRPLSSLLEKKIVLMGSTNSEISTLHSQIAAASVAANRRPGQAVLKPATAYKSHDWQKAKDEAQYTFHTLRPLPYLPGSERSLRFLERLRDDPGIKHAMRKHQFSVPLLTEMDPAMHTTHESRTLGLNRNQGEVIELRLRTDAYDGYRDYKTIRKTLCHELAHNVWGPHDRNFWNLCGEIEKEVDKADWTRGGRSVGQEEFYNPDDDMLGAEVVDHGGWTGGEFVLGGQRQSATGGLTRREILAKAAEERVKKTDRVEEERKPDTVDDAE